MSSSQRSVRVLLADDQELVRSGFRAILENAGFVVVAEASDGAQAMALARETKPDVVLLDVRMPHLDGLTALQGIVRAAPGTHVVMLTTFDLDEYLVEALRAGASGFLLKDVPRQHLVSAVQAAAEGQECFSPTILRKLVRTYVETGERRGPAESTAATDSRLTRLSSRELDVLRGITRGLTNSEIARELYLTEATVKTYVTRMLEKLGARRRLDAVLISIESGLVLDEQGEPPS